MNDTVILTAALTRLGEVREAHDRLSEAVLSIDYRSHPNGEAAGPIVVARMHVKDIEERLEQTGEMLRRILEVSMDRVV